MKTRTTVLNHIIFATILLSMSCSSNKDKITDNSNMQTITLPNDKGLAADNFIQKMDYVRLGSTGDMPIGEVSNLLFTDEHIIVVDSRYSLAVFIFDKKGENKAIINRRGKGPAEYIDLKYVALTPDKKQIAISDNRGSKIMFFDLNGNFISSKPMSFSYTSMEYIDDENIVFSTYGLGDDDPGLKAGNHGNDIVLYTDGDYNITDGVISNRYDRNKFNWNYVHVTKSGDDVYVTPVFCDTIYKAKADGLEVCYRIDMSEVGGMGNLDPTITDEQLRGMLNTETFFNGNARIGETFSLFSYSKAAQNVTVLHSQKNNKMYNMLLASVNPLYGYATLCSAVDKDQFVVSIPAFRIIPYSAYPKEMNGGAELYDGLTEDSNPILLFFTFKEPDMSNIIEPPVYLTAPPADM